LGVLGALLLTGTVYGQDGGLPARVNGGGTVPIPISAKRALKHSDYAGWKGIVGAQLSADGLWTSYAINPAEGDGELFFKKLDGSATWKVERGGAVRFSADSKVALITIAPKFADAEAARKAKREAPRSSTALIDLATGKVETLEKIRRAAFPEEGSGWLALHAEIPPAATTAPANPPAGGGTDQQRPQGQGRRPGGAGGPGRGGAPGGAGAGAPGAPRQGGSELTLRPLAGGTAATIPDVASFQFDQKGTRLVYIVDSKDDTKDGLYTRVLATGETTAIATGPGEVSTVTVDEAGEQVAFLRKSPVARGPQPADAPAPVSKLFVWHAGEAKPGEVGVASENAPPRFSKDGSYLVFGTAPVVKPRPKDAPEPIAVDIWSTRDGLIQTVQKLQLTAEQRRTFTNIYWIKNHKAIALADDKLRDVGVGAESKRLVLGSDPIPYLAEMDYDAGYRDYSLVDITTGTRRPIRKHSGGISLSPDEKWLLWWDGEKRSWWAQDVEGKLPPRDLTSSLKVKFQEEDWDTPGAPSSYGSAGWTAGDKRVVLYDRFDLWAIDPATGQAERLTQGRERGTTFRYTRLDPEERQIPEGKPLLLSSVDDETKATGWWQRASLTNPTLTKFTVYEGALGGLQKAKNSDTVLFTKERFEIFPDLWTAPTVAKAEQATRLTDANPQQAGINWGRSERILYRTGWGRELPAILTLPENFDPNKKYPLMVYIYEKLSQGLHRYVRPGPGTSINVSRYVSNGYIILQPDIEYRDGYPGESAQNCVIPAVQEVLRRGYIDEKRIGLQGHSWGAYQTAYLVTRTNIFRAVEAGAAVSDMFSAYGGIRYESGVSRQFQYEKTQSRIGATPWQKPLAYMENSPIFWADKVETPYLTIHNDNDGAVPWTQGIEFFMALRRLGKEAYLFNYNGEGHGLTNRDNMKHWTVHMAEFFDHYLLGAPRPEWMDKGVPYSERGTRDLREVYR
ncbi:MAG: prolyl oligopeptidase family serine peptidase, partial [Armatimonas sp.]